MHRRRFLFLAGAAGGASVALGRGLFTGADAPPPPDQAELAADAIIVGGGLGGCAATLAVLRAGCTAILTEETAWVGGQLTQQAVPPDENRWIEKGGANRSYLKLRAAIRDVYRQKTDPALLPVFRTQRELNPGHGWVSRLCHEPRVALAVLEGWLQPYVAAGRLRLLTHWKADAADATGDTVRAVTGRDLRGGATHVLRGRYFLDATEQGDLLPLANVEHVTGFESQKDTSEPHAPAEAQPRTIQAFTCCCALEYRAGEDHTIPKPADYDFWRAYEPQLTPPYNGRLFRWESPSPSQAGKTFGFDPRTDRTPQGPNLWTYRRIRDRKLYAPRAVPGDISIINWHQNDYYLGPLHAVGPDEAAQNLARAKSLSLALVHWLQTEAPRSDGKAGWPGLRLASEVVGSEDGLALYPYIRESRRIQAEFTVVEQHVLKQLRVKETGQSDRDVRAAAFADSVGIGHYPMDLHPSTGGANGLGFPTLPFQIPLGSLIPVRVNNLLPACKNLGVTHLTNGCYRLHPVEWGVGEAAGALAAYCVRTGEVPRRVRNHPPRLAEFQKHLRADGVALEWDAILRR